jgi:sugar-phosphatase
MVRDGHFPVLAGRGALFDMDGTLVDSAELVETLWAEFGERHGIDHARILSIAHERQSRDIIARFLPEEAVDAATAALAQEELTRLEGIKEVPGARDFLSRVASRVPVAIVTSAPRALAEARLEAAGVPVPGPLIGGGDVAAGKPAPDGYILAARRLAVQASTCLAFEDAEAGLAAATAAGARAVVVGSLDSPLANSLPRLPDFTRASVGGSTGRAEISGLLKWPGAR